MIILFRTAEREGQGGGATCSGPQTSKAPQLEKYLKIEQGPIKIRASTRHKRLHLKALKAPFRGINEVFSLVV